MQFFKALIIQENSVAFLPFQMIIMENLEALKRLF